MCDVRRVIILGVGVGLSLSLASPGRAAIPDMPEQDLASALARLAAAANIEVLFDEKLLAGERAPALHHIGNVEQALHQLLRKSRLSFRRTASGAIIIITTVATYDREVESAAGSPAPAIAEILVVGRRAQNVDIPRNRDDIQPYQIVNRDRFEQAQPINPEDFLRGHLSSNGQSFALSQAPLLNNGSPRSQIDLRGLGSAQTLVLIDGRRLPSVPAVGDFLQPDLNGLSTSMIDRIEALGATAGGIFGIGAEGGAVNVVLGRRFEGAEINLSSGISARGDAVVRGIDARAGYTSPDGHSRIMIQVGRREDDGLAFGDRPFVEMARLANRTSAARAQTVPSKSINIENILSGNLSFQSQLGGASLNARTTTLSLSDPALAQGGIALLVANAGHQDLTLSPDGQGALQSLITPTRANSILATVQQDIGSSLEVYLDLLRLDDEGIAASPAIDTTSTILSAGEAGNPFNQPIYVTFPTPGLAGHIINRTRTERLSVGLVARLGRGWTAAADMTLGRAAVSLRVDGSALAASSVNLFAGEDAIAAQLATLRVEPVFFSSAVDYMIDANVRFGGPVLRLPGGALTMTVTGEFRRERNPGPAEIDLAGPAGPSTQKFAAQRQEVVSLFAEARAPLLPEDSEFVPLRGLQVQLSLRHDRYRIEVPGIDPLSGEVTNSHGITALTIGARTTPITGLTLRTSFANGYTPPTPNQLVPVTLVLPDLIGLVDRARGGLQSDRTHSLTMVLAGSPTLRPQRAETFSAGFILEPAAVAGLRISVDYARLSTSRAITIYTTNMFQYFVDNEQLYPGRVTREPLTAADRANGYTAGRISAIDASALAVGRSQVQTIDFSFDYRHPMRSGVLSFLAQGTWYASLQRRVDLTTASFDVVGHSDGPLRWRGNGGAAWASGPWTLALNAQLYSSYSLTYASADPVSKARNAVILQQGGSRVPLQVYFDGQIAFQTGSARSGMQYRFGVKNLFDKKPPFVATPFTSVGAAIGYSAFGDPRGRSFAIDVTARF